MFDSIHLHHCQGGPPPLKFVIPAGAKRRDLQFHFRAQRKRLGRIAPGFRFPINANCRFLRYPGFPVEVGGVGNLMRLSSRKAAHAAVSNAVWQEILLCGRKSGFALSKNTSRRGPGGKRTADPSASSGFPVGVVVSVDLMRLSLEKAAYVVVYESGVVGNPEFAPNEQKIKPVESISISSVHLTLNLPQASRLLGMTKGSAVLT